MYLGKSKVAPVINWFSTTPWRRMVEWMYRSTFSWPLTSALVGGEWSNSRPGRFTPGERTIGTHWIGGWMGPRARLDDMENRKFLILPEPRTPIPRIVQPVATRLSRLHVMYLGSHYYASVHRYTVVLRPLTFAKPRISYSSVQCIDFFP
jgi:hypothetical protein